MIEYKRLGTVHMVGNQLVMRPGPAAEDAAAARRRKFAAMRAEIERARDLDPERRRKKQVELFKSLAVVLEALPAQRSPRVKATMFQSVERHLQELRRLDGQDGRL